MLSPDELPALDATDLARMIRAREISPVEAVEGSIARIEARNPSLNAFVYLGFDAARCADRHQGPVRFQARLAVNVRRDPRAEGQHRRDALRLCRTHGAGGRDHPRQD